MDPLHIRRQAHKLTLLYKITNNNIDIDPHAYLHSTNNQRTRNTHNQTYQTYYANTDAYKHSYFASAIRDWNRLPQHILNSNTIDSFTKQIHMHLSPQHSNTDTHTWFTSSPAHPVPPPHHQPTRDTCVLCTDLLVPCALLNQNQNQKKNPNGNMPQRPFGAILSWNHAKLVFILMFHISKTGGLILRITPSIFMFLDFLQPKKLSFWGNTAPLRCEKDK